MFSTSSSATNSHFGSKHFALCCLFFHVLTFRQRQSCVSSSDVVSSLTLKGVWTFNYFMAEQNTVTLTAMTVLQGAAHSEVGPRLSVTLMQWLASAGQL